MNKYCLGPIIFDLSGHWREGESAEIAHCRPREYRLLSCLMDPTQSETAPSSPGFRPAFSELTNEPVLALESPAAKDKKRKSLGRRVSFAAKAKVRFIEEPGTEGQPTLRAPSEGSRLLVVENDENEDDIFLSARREPAPDFVLSDSSPARQLSGQVQRLSMGESAASGSPGGRLSIVSNESIEVELRDPHSSFSSYDSEIDTAIGKGNMSGAGDTTGGEPMDLTGCVGGIIIANRSGRDTLSSSNDAPPTDTATNADDTTMDLTTCIGGILGQLKGTGGVAANNGNIVTTPMKALPDSPSSVDTMELTTMVGGIIRDRERRLQKELADEDGDGDGDGADGGEDPNTDRDTHGQLCRANPTTICTGGAATAPKSSPPRRDRRSEQQQQHTMEFTEVVRNTIKSAIAPAAGADATQAGSVTASPSPFLVTQSPMRKSMTMMMLKNMGGGGGAAAVGRSGTSGAPSHMAATASPLHSEVSFVGDLEAPPSLVHGMSPFVSPSRNKLSVAGHQQQEMAGPKGGGGGDDMDLTQELFNRYIDTNRLKAMTGEGAAEGHGNFAGVVAATVDAVDTPSKNLLPPSQAESPTVTILLPRASLKDFLNETGVRFLDNLSSLNRRETSGRPRESELVSPGRQLFVDGGLSLESDALDEGCQRLAAMIGELRTELGRAEEQFNHSPPLPYLEYQRDVTERPAVISKLKTLKSIARLYAKQAWYGWRTSLHEALNARLAENVQLAEERARLLVSFHEQLDGIIRDLEPSLVRLCDETATVRERVEWAQGGSDDLEHAKQLEQLAAFQQHKLTTIEEEMAGLMAREQQLRAAVELALAKRAELSHVLRSLREQVEASPETSPLLLDEQRSGLKLLQGTVGWRLCRMHPHELSLMFVRGAVGVTLGLDTNAKVTAASKESAISAGASASANAVSTKATVISLAFDVASTKSRLLKYAPRLVKLPDTGSQLQAPMSVSEALLWIGQRLDRLCHLDRQLAVVGVQCQVTIPETIAPETESVPIALGFLHPASRTKFDLLLTVDGGGGLSYSQFVHFYGPIQEHHVLDQVKMALQAKHGQARRAVAAVMDIIDDQLA